MNIIHNPQLLDQLAAGYALGTLRGGARRRFEALARQSATVRAAALIWQERFASMTELQASDMPSPNVWKRIENLLNAETPAAVVARQSADAGLIGALRRALGLWRGAALAGGVAAAAAVVVGINLNADVRSLGSQMAGLTQQRDQLAAELRAAPQVQYVAVLADGKSDAAMVVTFDPRAQRMVLRRVGGYQEEADKSLQLWALPPSGGPRSLGVLGSEPVARLTAAENVREAPALAISLEPRGGVPGEGGPTGPVLFKGALLRAGS